MPIDKDKLEKTAIERVEDFLRENPDKAYSLEELESELDLTGGEKEGINIFFDLKQLLIDLATPEKSEFSTGERGGKRYFYYKGRKD